MADKLQVVRLKAGKVQLEVLVKPGTVAKYREGKLTMDQTLGADVVFKNSSKSERANAVDLNAVCNTDNEQECLKIILEKGEFHLSTEERREKVEKKRKEIVNYIHKYYIDPKLNRPHPVTRIESALADTKYRVDMDQPAERQALEALKKLVDHIPLKRAEEMTGQLKLPHRHIGTCQGIVRKLLTVTAEKYTGEGCEMEISIIPGNYDELVKQLHDITKDDYTLNISGMGGMATADDAEASSKGGKKGKGGKGKGGKRK